MMKKTMLIALLFGLMIIPSVLSIEITNETRSPAQFWKSVSNYTSEYLWFENLEHRHFFVKFKVIPDRIVAGLDYNVSNWNPNLKIINGNEIVYVDTSPCWEWEDPTSPYFLNETWVDENCPEVSFEVTPNTDILELEFVGEDLPSRPAIPFRLYYYGYTTAYADEYITYSETKNTAKDALAELFTLNINAWKGAYYLMVVVVLVLGALFVIGFIPLMVKKFFEKSVK
jgi:hypothetical protein